MDDDLHLANAVLALVKALETGDEDVPVAKNREVVEGALAEAKHHAEAVVKRYDKRGNLSHMEDY